MHRVPSFLAVLLAASACSPDAESGPRATERVSIGMDVERARAAVERDPRPSWDLRGTWVVTDTRSARTSPASVGLEQALAATGPIVIRTAAAVLAPARADDDATAIEFEVRLRLPSGDLALARHSASVHDARHAWIELQAHADVPEGVPAKLVLVARSSRAAEGDTDDGTQVAWAVPTVVAADSKPRNVLVLSVDTLRADHLGIHGYSRPTSPHIDALLARGVYFETAIATAPWTLPSYGSLFTGLAPGRHRAGVSSARDAGFGTGRDVAHGDFERLSSAHVTLAECFARAGYLTAGIVCNPYFDPVTGIDRGFSTWIQYLNRASAGVEIAERWVERADGAPWFLFLHLLDPHGPYAPPAPFDRQFSGRAVSEIPGFPPSLDELRARAPDAATRQLLVDLYDGEIAYVDAEVGKFLAFLGARGELDRTLVVFHSDHGEEFFEHGSCEHGLTLFDEVLHVPLGFVMPGRLPAGVRVSPRTSVVDVFPTILDLCGLPMPPAIDGQSLVPACLGSSPEARPTFAEGLLYGPRELALVATATEAFVTDGARHRALYDLIADPGETRDVLRERPERARALEALLDAHRAAARRDARSSLVGPPDAARDARLRALGYPGSSRPGDAYSRRPH